MRIYLLIVLLLIPIVFATEECGRFQDPSDIPCLIISSWKPASGCVTPLYAYNSTGNIVLNTSWQAYTPTCNATFNISTPGTYFYNSSIEDGIITVRSSKMWLAAILMIPLGVAFLFIHWANSLNENQEPLKWFFRLLSLLMIFVLYIGADMVITASNSYSQLADLFNITAVTWIFYTTVAVFLVYFIYRIFASFQEKKDDDFEQGILR